MEVNQGTPREQGEDKERSFGGAMRNGTGGRALGWVSMELGVLAGCPFRYSGSWGRTPSWALAVQSHRADCGRKAESMPPSPYLRCGAYPPGVAGL